MKNLLFISLILFTSTLYAQQLAFPSAEGFGRYATGGRGGTVYHVTNLNDSGPGSFRDAVSEPNRTVVFDVGGVINISSRIIISPNITIAGQTAPGEGITIYGNGLSYSNADNTITRYIRIRMGKIGDSGKDAVAIAEGHDMIFDHVSITWGRDGTFDLNGDVSNVTLQNSIIGQGLQTHSTGGLIQSSGGVSILRCLYIDNHTRNPKVKGYNQYINNVVYNWAVAGYILGDSEGYSEANVLNNYFIDGPETSSLPFNRANENFHLYAGNNYWDNNRNGILDGVVVDTITYGPVTWSDTPFDQPEVTMLTPQEAYNEVFNYSGASLHRDQVDSLLINELASLGTLGQTISDETSLPTNGPGTVAGGPSYPDADGDGMPDYYEIAVGLNINNSADGNEDEDQDGYTNLEEYLNCLTGKCDITMPDPPARQPQRFVFSQDNSGNTSWDWIGNWNLGYLPASGDTVIIQNGTATISGNKSGVITFVKDAATLIIADKTALGNIFLEGGILKGKDSLIADIIVSEPSQIESYDSSAFILNGDLNGDEELTINADNKIIFNTQGNDFSGKLSIEKGLLEIASPDAIGSSYLRVKSGSIVKVSESGDFNITFLEMEEGASIYLDDEIIIPGGKLGDKSLKRNRSYTRHNMPDYISGEGKIKVSSRGSYDCTGTWNGTAYRDDCWVCVEGTTDRQPCDTSIETGAYTLTALHSQLCIQADSSLRQEECKASPTQAIEFIKTGSLYQLRQLQGQQYIVPFTFENGQLDLEKISLSPYPIGYFRIEKVDMAYRITPALRPDDLISVADSSMTNGAFVVVSERAEESLSQAFSITPYYDCSGERDGLAQIDSCGFCAGGNTGETPCTASFEAEEYCLLDGVIEEHPDRDYSGEGYLNYDNVTGSKATYNLYSTLAQDATIRIRYANGSSNRPLKVLVNGEEQIANIDFPSTGGWNNWMYVPIDLEFSEGDNYVEFVATSSSGAANIDNFILFTEGVSLTSCPILDCFGTPNGTAYLDDCGFCVGGSTGVNPCKGQWEAEQYCELDGVIEAIAGRGYSGEGYLNYENTVGSKATYNIVSPHDQETTFRVRYANGSGNRPLHVFVNGTEQVSQVDFPSTGGWATWSFADIPLQLTAGDNYVEMTSLTSGGAANIDLIIYTDSVSLGTCPEADCNGDIGGTATIDDCGVCSGGNTGIEVNACQTALSSASESDVIYYPNTFSEELNLRAEQPFTYQVYDKNTGTIVLEGHTELKETTIGQNLKEGFYILHIIRENKILLKASVIKGL